MMKKLLATLIVAAFSATAFGQAQPAEPKGETGTQTQKAQPAAKKHAKAQKKERSHKSGDRAKGHAKAKADAKGEAGK